MTWTCPYELKGFCSKRKKGCKPLAKGCVLEGKGLKITGSEVSETVRKKRQNPKNLAS